MSNSISSFSKVFLDIRVKWYELRAATCYIGGGWGGGGKIDKTDTFMTMNWMTKVKLKSRLHLTLNSSVSIHADELLTNSSQEVASGFY